MKNYFENMEMITRQVEAERETPLNWFLLISKLERFEKAMKFIVYFYLCDKIEENHWKNNFRGVRELLDLEVKKLALARYMGLTE